MQPSFQPTSGPQSGVLCHKISASKWRQAAATGKPEDRQDAIRSGLGLREGEKGLSFWIADGTEIDIQKATTGILAGSTRPETTDILMLPADAITAIGAQIKPSPGRTPFRPARNRHVDVYLSANQQEKTADLIIQLIQDRNPIRRIPKAIAIDMVQAEVRAGQIDAAELSPSWQNAVAKAQEVKDAGQ